MEFSPLNDQQIKELNLYPEGIYRFKTERATQKPSSNGGMDFFNLKHTIEVNGRFCPVFDNLFFEGKMIYKTKHYCDVTGMKEKYESGKIMPFECDNKEGYLELKHTTNSKTGELQNSVRDYVMPEGMEAAKIDENLNDEIPW